MENMENKEMITKKLEELINLTREGLVELTYCEDTERFTECVEIERVEKTPDLDTGNYEVTRQHLAYVNVTADSGLALCRDVLRFFS